MILAVALSMSVMAQDILVKRNGERLNVKVLSVAKKKVTYVRQGTDMPIYTIKVAEIEYIQYPMGDRDTFGKGAMTTTQKESVQGAELSKWHGAVPAPAEAQKVESVKAAEPAPQTQQEATSKTYAIGDIYSDGNIKGIVVLITDGGRHGTIMSLDEACLAWSTEKNKTVGFVGATNATDGVKNMEAVEAYIAKNGLSWDIFPAFKWCRDKGEGWYLPSLNEIWSAGTMYLGGSRIAAHRRVRKYFNEALVEEGGKPLSNTMYYYSSTEDKDRRYAFYTHMNTEPPHTNTDF